MRAVVQRVESASVRVDGDVVGRIGRGLLAFVGVADGDDRTDAQYVASKLRDLRVFEDAQGKMNRSVVEADGAILIVSQFTLLGDCRKGRRPSFDQAAAAPVARALCEHVVADLRAAGVRVETGRFQAAMRVELVNAGPVTLLLDSRRAF